MEHTEASKLAEPTLPQQLALALGWSAAEFVGRYRHGIHPRNPGAQRQWRGAALPRLTYSRRTLSANNDLFWLLAQRLVLLSDALGLDDLEGKDEEGSVDARIRELPGEIRVYIADPDATTALDAEAFYQLLEDWTQLIRLALGVRARSLREAFSFGGELADLYWALPVPQRHNLPEWAETWRKIGYRVPESVRALQRVRASLPPYACAALSFSLRRWRCVRPSWLECEFTLEQARELSARLGEQSALWGQILQGDRLPEDYLHRSDWRWVDTLSAAGFVVTLLAILLAFSGFVVVAFNLVVDLIVPGLRGLLPLLPQHATLVETPTVSDWLAIGGVLAAAVGLLVSAGAWFFHRLGDIHRWIRRHLIPLFVRRRTLALWREASGGPLE